METSLPVSQQQALEIAQQVAREILENSYEQAIHDVLLFGSAIRESVANDIDFLLIHRYAPLLDFGIATSYDNGKVTADPREPLRHGEVRAELVLQALGSKNVPCFFEAMRQLYVAAFRFLSGMDETLLNPLNGHPIEIENRVGDDAFYATIERSFEAERENSSVLHRVTEIIKSSGLRFDEFLDIQVMHASLLTSNPEVSADRSIIIQQSDDPTFWHEVLTTGKLYNADSGEFDIDVDSKYPGATALFEVKQ